VFCANVAHGVNRTKDSALASALRCNGTRMKDLPRCF
jgi:hypothetical protein